MPKLMIKCIKMITLVVLFNQCTASMNSSAHRFHPSPRVKDILTWRDEGGSVYCQARSHDNYDYRGTLDRASRGDSQALQSIFVYTKNGSQMGEGAETHIEVLGELLKQWGDPDYANVLSNQTSEVTRSVSQMLNEYWGYPGWPRDKYAITHRICAGSMHAEPQR